MPHVVHPGVAANNYGPPELPLASGDTLGVKSVQTVTLSAGIWHQSARRRAVAVPAPGANPAEHRLADDRERLWNQLPSAPQIMTVPVWAFLLGAGARRGSSHHLCRCLRSGLGLINALPWERPARVYVHCPPHIGVHWRSVSKGYGGIRGARLKPLCQRHPAQDRQHA
ncbi:MAG: hypothetical protein IPN53_22940 [Comamonadaceae bacterium]|nr:hypothetical protein [Comamonadaceae bacterium]